MSLLLGALWHVPVSMYSRNVKPRSRLGWLGEGERGPAQEFLNSSVEFLTNWGMEQLLTVTAITLFRLSIWGWSAWFTPTPDSVSWLFQSSSALNAPMFLPLIIIIAYLWQHIMANFVLNQVWKRKSLHVYWLLSDTILFNSNIFSMNDLIHRDIKYACLEIQLFRWKTHIYYIFTFLAILQFPFEHPERWFLHLTDREYYFQSSCVSNALSLWDNVSCPGSSGKFSSGLYNQV